MGHGQSTQGVEILWKSPTSSPTQPVRSKVEILQRKDRFILDKFTAAFDLNKLSQVFETNARKKFHKVSSCSIKITAKCRMSLPSDHPGVGNPAWIFVDEIVVK
jgi:hypothetical protein